MRGKKTSDDLRTQVIAALLVGQSVSEVAATYKLPQTTVTAIKKAIPPSKFAELRSKKEDDLDGKIISYLHANLDSLKAQVDFFKNETWLNKQSAESLAVLHGVQADKAFRLLEAIQPPEGSSTPETA